MNMTEAQKKWAAKFERDLDEVLLEYKVSLGIFEQKIREHKLESNIPAVYKEQFEENILTHLMDGWLAELYTARIACELTLLRDKLQERGFEPQAALACALQLLTKSYVAADDYAVTPAEDGKED